MTRIVAGAAPPLEEIEFFLWLGPPNSGPPEFSDEQAAAAWRAYGRTIMADWPRDKPGFRPEAFWQYEIGERPDTHEAAVLLLAERGLLFDEEVEALAARRTYWHINDECERTDPEAVALYEQVCEALGR